jgi:uncharacterized membrane protein
VLAAATITTIILWAAWAVAIRNDVFSIRPGIEIDPQAQLLALVSHPGRSVVFFVKEMAILSPKLALGSVGAKLGWGELGLPAWFIYPVPFFLTAAALSSERPERRSTALIVAALLVGLACYVAIFLLLYLQFNAVGAAQIEGVNGRYLTPLAILLFALCPKLNLRPAQILWAAGSVAFFGFLSVVLTLSFVWLRYW